MTIHGNLKSPGYAKVIEWLSKTWEDFDSATIVESFNLPDTKIRIFPTTFLLFFNIYFYIYQQNYPYF
jgi:hypothetical protein